MGTAGRAPPAQLQGLGPTPTPTCRLMPGSGRGCQETSALQPKGRRVWRRRASCPGPLRGNRPDNWASQAGAHPSSTTWFVGQSGIHKPFCGVKVSGRDFCRSQKVEPPPTPTPASPPPPSSVPGATARKEPQGPPPPSPSPGTPSSSTSILALPCQQPVLLVLLQGGLA